MSNLGAFPRFSLNGPPRHVPLLVTLRLLFGGFLNQFGWLFFGFGMIFFWIFACNGDYLGLIGNWGAVETVQGTVTRSEESGASEGGGKHSKGRPIFANHYRFEHAEQSYEGVSYATGRRLRQGQGVVIEFPVGRPDRSRIQGMRRSIFGPMVGVVVIFPLVGLICIVSGFRQGWKSRRLLRHGEQADGTLTDKQPTSTRINKRTVFKMTFDFQDQLGQSHQAVVKTHLVERLEDDVVEPLLYDPLDPRRSTLLDHLPGSPKVGQSGEITLEHPLATLLVLILPLVSVCGHGIAAWYMWNA